jgi:hypothetical protein
MDWGLSRIGEFCTAGAMSAFTGTAGEAGDRALSSAFDPELPNNPQQSLAANRAQTKPQLPGLFK